MVVRVGVLIDYQNIHLTARDLFGRPGTGARETLIHPALFAERLVRVRAATVSDATQVVSIAVFRGVPSNAKQPDLYAAAQAQRSQWTRDPRVRVHYRPLRYGRRPDEPPREKGVDVHLAVELVRAVYLVPGLDVAVVASHDRDLEPALDLAAGSGRVSVETVGWHQRPPLRVRGRLLRHTTLGLPDFLAARDPRDYWRRA